MTHASPENPRKILGTTVDFPSAFRDLFLAGGFTALVAWAATEDAAFLLYGFLTGAMLGVVLHILPPEPRPGDSRSGRITLRAISGAIAGVYLGPGMHWMVSGVAVDVAETPSNDALLRAGLLGLLAGLVWYIAWGLWETRNLDSSADVNTPAAH